MKTFEELFGELRVKAEERPEDSGTVRELDSGIHFIGKKILEEAGEASQLLYHLQCMLIARGLTLADVYRYL